MESKILFSCLRRPLPSPSSTTLKSPPPPFLFLFREITFSPATLYLTRTLNKFLKMRLKELRYRSCILKKNWLNFSKSLFRIRFNLRHPQPSLFLCALESSLWCFSSLENVYFQVSQQFYRNLGRQRNDSKYREVARL